MTEATIISLENARMKIREYEGLARDLRKYTKSIESNCDHEYPDGITAITHDLLNAGAGYCEICERHI